MKTIVRLTESELVRIVKRVLNESDDDFQTKPGFVKRRMQQQKDYESKFNISFPIPIGSYDLLKKMGVPDDNIVTAYGEYVKHALGITYGTDLSEFKIWCDNPDNLVDFK